MEINGVKIKERGWAAHFCLARKCAFHRNTLLEKGDVKIVISSVGKMPHPYKEGELYEIGCDRFYETMVFFANDDKWQDADVSKGEIKMFAPPKTDEPWDEMPANDLHDKVVEMYIEKMSNDEEILTISETIQKEEEMA